MLHLADLSTRLRAALEPDPDPEPAGADRLAAVLALLVGSSDPTLIFTVRATSLSRHAGEVSFPGGLLDPGESPAGAALRETQEELGLDPALTQLLGAMSPVQTHVSGILVVPFVGMLAALPALQVNGSEIDEVFTSPIHQVAAAEAPMKVTRADGTVWSGWRYDLGSHVVWGATALMVHELVELLRKEAPWMTAARS
jgi:8-oxo-dGTP pyrophosphatase MutT (NUDIX family)